MHLRYVYSLIDGRCNIHIGASLENYSAVHMAFEICKTCTVSICTATQPCICYGRYKCSCMQAFKVMEQCSSYKSGCVETGVILFSIEVVRVGFRQQKAIQGTSMYGMKYTFLDGSRVFFSSRQCDTRCSLWECADIIRYPQKVTAFLNEEESREFPQLKNLSELTLTGKEEKKYLLMCKMKEDGSIERKLHTLPADSTTKVYIHACN